MDAATGLRRESQCLDSQEVPNRKMWVAKVGSKRDREHFDASQMSEDEFSVDFFQLENCQELDVQ
jgi:hypothetical protein